MGVLGMVIRLPFLLYLVAGVWVDRTRRRRILIGTDLARGVLLLSIPVAALIDVLSLPFLIVVVFTVMVITVWFDIAYLSYVPALVPRQELTTANTLMETSNSTAQVAGTSVGGFLVQLLTAPIAILVDSLSYFISASRCGESGSRSRRCRPGRVPACGTSASSIAAGVRFVVSDRILAPLALAIGIFCSRSRGERRSTCSTSPRVLHLGAASSA